MDKEIVEGNKLIAEFMGVSHAAGDNGLFYYVNGDSYDSLEYHTSWDWLMPVVIKIDKDFPEPMTQKAEIYDSLLCLDFKRLLKAVVSFIQWYNSITK